MSTTTLNPRGGNQPRRASIRLFALIDEQLASKEGLDVKRFCREHDCSDKTVERYLFELMSYRIKIIRTGGVWRYDEGQARVFTEHGASVFQLG
jgi:hypothetical protein